MAIGGVSLTAGSYPFFVERHLLAVNRYRLEVPHLPEAFAGMTVAHLTDLHYGPLVSMGFLRMVIAKTNSLAADMIVCTGDYVHSDNAVDTIEAIWPELCALRAPLGVHSVLGNHDHWASTARSVELLEKSGQSISHRCVALERNGERLWLAGAGDLWEDHRPLDNLLAPVPPDECCIVLAHNPDTADTPCDRRIDLMVCGHTHGGQVRLPIVGAPVLPVQNLRYSSGPLHSDRGFPLFISRGIGWAILPVRFGCRPEIALLELQPLQRTEISPS